MEEKKINQNLETVEDERDNIEETEKVGTQANANKDEGKAEKTFTQEEVNAILTKEKKKVKRFFLLNQNVKRQFTRT